MQLWREYERSPEGVAHRAQAAMAALDASPEQLRAVVDFAERGITRELGAFDPRNNYTDAELTEMNARFANARAGIDAITRIITRQSPTSDTKEAIREPVCS